MLYKLITGKMVSPLFLGCFDPILSIFFSGNENIQLSVDELQNNYIEGSGSATIK